LRPTNPQKGNQKLGGWKGENTKTERGPTLLFRPKRKRYCTKMGRKENLPRGEKSKVECARNSEKKL